MFFIVLRPLFWDIVQPYCHLQMCSQCILSKRVICLWQGTHEQVHQLDSVQLNSQHHMPCFCKWFTIRLHSKPTWTAWFSTAWSQKYKKMKICVLSATTKSVIGYVSDLLHNENVYFLVYDVHVVTLSNLSSWYLYQYLITAHSHQVVNVECMTSVWDIRSCTMISMKGTWLVTMVSTTDFAETWDSLCTRY